MVNVAYFGLLHDRWQFLLEQSLGLGLREEVVLQVGNGLSDRSDGVIRGNIFLFLFNMIHCLHHCLTRVFERHKDQGRFLTVTPHPVVSLHARVPALVRLQLNQRLLLAQNVVILDRDVDVSTTFMAAAAMALPQVKLIVLKLQLLLQSRNNSSPPG